MLSVFQAMTLTNWSFTMYRTMDFLSPAVVIYWVVLIVFGAFFVVREAGRQRGMQWRLCGSTRRVRWPGACACACTHCPARR
jgi:hypothetical protein